MLRNATFGFNVDDVDDNQVFGGESENSNLMLGSNAYMRRSDSRRRKDLKHTGSMQQRVTSSPE